MAASIRVLHVEDDHDFAEVTASFLERESDAIEVRTESDPTAVATEPLPAVDCVVSDYDMPAMDGIELLERVRAVDPDLPFILFTGKGSEEVASEALSKGATDYLQKEVGTDQYAILANRIENAVAQRRSVAQLERQGEILETAQEIAQLGVCEYDIRTGEVWFSEGMYSEFDVDRPGGSGSVGTVDVAELPDFFHPADRERVRTGFERIVERGESVDREVRLDRDGRWVRIRGEPKTTDGEVTRIRATIQDVTDRRVREQELRRTERRFQAVFEDPQRAVVLLDTDGTLLDCNDAVLSYVEATREAVRGDRLWETPWLTGEGQDAVREWVRRAADGEYVTFDRELSDQHGDVYHVSGLVRPVRDGDGEVVSLILSAADVTERRERLEQRDFYELLVGETTDLITVVDEDGVIQYQNPAVETALGHDQEALRGEQVVELLHPEEEASVTRWFEGIVSDSGPPVETIETRVATADGSWRWLESRAHNRSKTAIGGYVITSRDVTERKERERELENFEQIIEGMGDGLYALGPQGGLEYINPAGIHVTGYDAETLYEEGPELVFDEAAVEQFEQEIVDLYAAGGDGVRTVDTAVSTADGERIPVEATLTMLTDEDGAFLGTVGVLRDVSAQKARERELREYESIVRALPDLIAVLDTEGVITRIIPPVGTETAASSYRPEDLEGEPASTVMRDEDLEQGAELIAEMITSDRERAAFEMQILGADGEAYWREDHLSLLTDGNGEIQGTVGVLRDIEERKASERELERQNERLEEFAEIASHDLRNPLNLAQGYLELVADECDSEHTATVRDALERMERLIDDTLTMARQGTTVSERTEIDLDGLAARCWDAVGSEAATVSVAEGLTIEGDESRIKQVFENLFRNAVEHGGEGVTIRVGAIDGEGIFVADDGPGIPEDDRDAVFDAGYTTASEGTGFGLAIVGEIVDAHGWDIAVTESESGGARFEITGVDVAS